MIANIWAKSKHWLENGDLVPLLVIVSVFHYPVVLAQRDHIISAIAIGVLVDIGHYRFVRAAVRYTGSAYLQLAVRWGGSAILTAISLVYQLRYYDGDLALALPIPALIIGIAVLMKLDEHLRRSEKSEVATEISNGRYPRIPCPVCGDSYGSKFYTSERSAKCALSAHQKVHNGN